MRTSLLNMYNAFKQAISHETANFEFAGLEVSPRALQPSMIGSTCNQSTNLLWFYRAYRDRADKFQKPVQETRGADQDDKDRAPNDAALIARHGWPFSRTGHYRISLNL